MENYKKAGRRSMLVLGTPLKQKETGRNSLDECRGLVNVLAKKTETLYRECRFDQGKAGLIREMGLTLAALTTMVNKLDRELHPRFTRESIEDAHGNTYHTVRSCDLDRISEK
jgi:hypothetical protein